MTIKKAAQKPQKKPKQKDGESVYLDTLKRLRIVIRAAQRHSAWIEKKCGVSGAQLWVMQELQETPDMRVGEIAAKMAIHQTTVSNLLDVLVRRAYVVKTRDPSDQRVVRLALSQSGSDVLAGAPKPAKGLLPEALSQLTPAQLALLNQGLDELLISIGTLDESFGMQPLPFTM